MMGSRLAALLDQATPGPWEWVPRMWPETRVTALRSTTATYPEMPGVPRGVIKRLDGTDNADARLIALAPDLARLLVDMAEWVEDAYGYVDNSGLFSEGEELLARFAALDEKAGGA